MINLTKPINKQKLVKDYVYFLFDHKLFHKKGFKLLIEYNINKYDNIYRLAYLYLKEKI